MSWALERTRVEFPGVATREDPVAIAQRQVDNGWGAYEIYDANGCLESVFIRLGKSLHLTAVPRLPPSGASNPSGCYPSTGNTENPFSKGTPTRAPFARKTPRVVNEGE